MDFGWTFSNWQSVMAVVFPDARINGSAVMNGWMADPASVCGRITTFERVRLSV